VTDPITPLTPEQAAQNAEETQQEGYVHRVLVGIDQAANVILDTGIKHEVGKAISAGLDLFQKDHGAGAIEGDLTRAQDVEGIEQASGVVPN
jgi:hypothetical protein